MLCYILLLHIIDLLVRADQQAHPSLKKSADSMSSSNELSINSAMS